MANKVNKTIKSIQNEIKSENADAWLIIDYENKNPSTLFFLGKMMLTRKIFISITATGKPFIIAHSIDMVFLKEKSDSFDLFTYNTWQEMLELERQLFGKYKTVLMDVSDKGLLPRVSLADYGSVEFIKSLGLTIKSSENVLQLTSAKYDNKSYKLQLMACEKTLFIKDQAFKEIAKQIRENGKSNEYEIQQFICRRFKEEGMVYDELPIVATGKNASNPHYGPTKSINSDISKGDLVLIDMWAKMDDEYGVYADITWMGYVGDSVPKDIENRFNILKEAVSAGISFIRQNINNDKLCGYMVDNVVRGVVNHSGYGKYFTHRTGHNISVDDTPHGPGANIDNYESHDTRKLIDMTSFSIEPGIYAPDFGMRSETNVMIKDGKALIMGGLQESVIPILSLKNI